MILQEVAKSYNAKKVPANLKNIKRIKLKRNYYLSQKELKKFEKMDKNLQAYFLQKILAFYDKEFEEIKIYPDYYQIVKNNNKYYLLWYKDYEKN